MNSGIYMIKNLTNNKVYIGSSLILSKRQYKHFWMLKKGIHDNEHLQKSYNLNGYENFKFEIVELCSSDLLVEKENFYIKKYSSDNSEFGYNLSMVNEFRRNVFNSEFKVKLSKYNLEKNKNFSKFSLTNIQTNEIFIYDNLVDCANYLIEKGFAKGKPTNVRMKISQCLRGVKVDNGYKGSIRKSCYKHKLNIIN